MRENLGRENLTARKYKVREN